MVKRVGVFVLVLICIPLSALTADWTTEFRKAVERNDIAAVKRILDKNPKLIHVDDNTGGSWDNPGHNCFTALHSAAYDGHVEMIKLLISRGTNVNLLNHDNSTPLHVAAMEGRLEVAKLLISKGAKVNVRNYDDYTPLWYAVDAGSVEITKLLIDNGAKMDVDICDGMAVLHLAAQKGNLAICRILVDKGAKVDGIGRCETPLCYAARQGHIDVMRYLTEKGANVNARFGDVTSLSEAVRSNHYEAAKLLISKDADVNVRNEHGSTLLHTAVGKGNAKLVELLTVHGADVSARLPDTVIPVGSTRQPVVKGKTPLGLALELKKTEIADILRKHGAIE